MFTPTKKLNVHRRLSDGRLVLVGQLAQNSQQVFFQYDSDYLIHHQSLSPFNLPFDNSLNPAPQTPHAGLQGVFADSLPDGWGLLLMDRVFRQQGISPDQITPMDRLAYMMPSQILRGCQKMTIFTANKPYQDLRSLILMEIWSPTLQSSKSP